LNQATNDHIQRTNLAAVAERLNGPEYVQAGRATRYPDAGTGISIAYVAEDAPASDHIKCFLDYDGTDPYAWVTPTDWELNDTTTGDDTKIYRCKLPYTATNDTTKPGVLGQETVWGVYWKVIEEIEVYCDITGGGNLSDARRHLLTMQKSIGYNALILANPPEEWTAKWWAIDKVVIGTNSKEHYRCILAHNGTVDNRPSSGDDWETNWEVAKYFADKLKVIKIDGRWEALEGFAASAEGGLLSP
jgi:hypothetical protein